MQIVRGSASAPLSQLASILEPALRKVAGLGSWLVLSGAAGRQYEGIVVSTGSLSSVQGHTFPDGTILVAKDIGGDDDIPEVPPLPLSHRLKHSAEVLDGHCFASSIFGSSAADDDEGFGLYP